jgi:hypothetical protein
VAAVRVPLLHLSNFQINDWPELSAKSYAIMVLMLPSDSARKWHVHELELVEVVADQVTTTLCSGFFICESFCKVNSFVNVLLALSAFHLIFVQSFPHSRIINNIKFLLQFPNG